MKQKYWTKSLLPDKPSALIRVALRDLSKVERSGKYKVEMGHWHTPNSVCKVCLAGAVMAKTFGIDPKQLCWPDQMGIKNAGKLEALNDFRMGNVREGLKGMEIKLSYEQEVKLNQALSKLRFGFGPTPYSVDKRRFKEDMRKMADVLKKVGL